jgi:seryl-tRNA synthetase
MGLDLNLFRTERGGNPDTIKESCKKRYQDPVIVDKIIEKDQEWRKARFVLDNLNKDYNKGYHIIINIKL